MKQRSLRVTAIAIALVLLTPMTASSQDFRQAVLTAESLECGQVTVTLQHPYGFGLVADFGFGDPTAELSFSDAIVREGPYAGEEFGNFYESPNGTAFRVDGPGSGSQTLLIPEDTGGGSVEVTYRVKAGAEQRTFILPQTIIVDTDCEASTPDECKNGGWAEYGFTNQGQCLQFVNTGKDSRI